MPDKAKDTLPAHWGILAPLWIPDYRRLMISNALWWLAMWMEMIVVGWLVLEMTDSAWQVALIGFYRMAPVMVVGFFSGPIVDRFGRRTIILLDQAVSFIVSAAVALLLWTGRLAFWHLALSALILGLAWALDWTARRSILPDLVGRSRTVDAMIVEGFAGNIARILGPFAGGGLIEVIGARGCFTVLSGIYALSFIVLLRLSSRTDSRSATALKTSAWTLIAEGLRYVRHSQTILGDLLITIAMNFLVFPYMALLPVFARDILNQGPMGLGLLGAASGIGFFVGLFVVNHIRHSISAGWIFAAGSTFMGIALIGFSASTHFTLSLFMLILAGLGQACFNIMQSSIVLLSSSDAMRSRAMGALLLAIGAGPPGRLQMGGIAEAFGAPIAVGLTAAAAVITVIAITAALPGFRRGGESRDAPTGPSDTEEKKPPESDGS